MTTPDSAGHRPPGEASHERGSILVIVLMLVGVIAALAAAAAEMQRATHAAGLAYADGLRAETAMRSAIERTVAHGGDRTQQLRGGIVRMEQAVVTLDIRDEASRIDLNFAGRELLAGLFRAVGGDEASAGENAERIMAWRDPEDTKAEAEEPKAPAKGGIGVDKGEQNEERLNSSGGVAYPKRPFLHPAQIAQVPGIERAFAEAVAPHLTVASGRPTINPMLADLPVLMAVPGMTHDRAVEFMRTRGERPEAFAELLRQTDKGTDYLSLSSGAAVRFFGQVRIEGRTQRVFETVVTVVAGDSMPYRVLSWDAVATPLVR